MSLTPIPYARTPDWERLVASALNELVKQNATPEGTVSLAEGGTGASLADPGANRIMFWDDSASAVDWLTVGTGLSISGTTLGVTAASGWTQLATSSASGASVTFTGLSLGYADLLIVYAGVGHNSGSVQSLRMLVSNDNGSSYTFSAPANDVSPTISGASVLYGSSLIRGYANDVSIGEHVTAATTSSALANAAGTEKQTVYQASTGIDALQFVWSGGNHDAGTITVYGR